MRLHCMSVFRQYVSYTTQEPLVMKICRVILYRAAVFTQKGHSELVRHALLQLCYGPELYIELLGFVTENYSLAFHAKVNQFHGTAGLASSVSSIVVDGKRITFLLYLNDGRDMNPRSDTLTFLKYKLIRVKHRRKFTISNTAA